MKIFSRTFACLLLISVLSFSATAQLEIPSNFVKLSNFPAMPGGFSFGIAADVLPDGRYIVYDGESILIQDGVGVDGFTEVATGFTGDPAFITLSPDGVRAVIGTGFLGGGDIFLFDTLAPAGPSAPIVTIPNSFSAVFLDDDKVLIDNAFDTGWFVFVDELSVLDLAPATPVLRKVVSNKGGASAAIAVSANGAFVYSTDGLTGDTRRLAVDDVLAAFDTDTPIEWSTGLFMGTYNSGGASAVTPDNLLVFGGFSGTLQFVNGDTFAVEGTRTPDAALFTWLAVYNSVTKELLAIGADFDAPPNTAGWVSIVPLRQLPAARTPALILLALAMIIVARKRFTTHRSRRASR